MLWDSWDVHSLVVRELNDGAETGGHFLRFSYHIMRPITFSLWGDVWCIIVSLNWVFRPKIQKYTQYHLPCVVIFIYIIRRYMPAAVSCVMCHGFVLLACVRVVMCHVAYASLFTTGCSMLNFQPNSYARMIYMYVRTYVYHFISLLTQTKNKKRRRSKTIWLRTKMGLDLACYSFFLTQTDWNAGQTFETDPRARRKRDEETQRPQSRSKCRKNRLLVVFAWLLLTYVLYIL